MARIPRQMPQIPHNLKTNLNPITMTQNAAEATSTVFMGPAKEKNLDGAVCCVVWSLSKSAQISIELSQLTALHAEIVSCAHLIGARVLECDAAHGALVCENQIGANVTTADSGVHLGHLICVWAAAQEPQVGIRVGAHQGSLREIDLPGNRKGYFGNSISTARHLAENAQCDACVHLQKSTKDHLCAMEHLPLSYAPFKQCYFVKPGMSLVGNLQETAMKKSEKAQDFSVKDTLARLQKGISTFNVLEWAVTGKTKLCGRGTGNTSMTLDEFTGMLQDHNIDVFKYGQGNAKSLELFYAETVKQQKACLVETPSGDLERFLELVRINLVAASADGSDCLLRLSTEILNDGRARMRNQKVAQVVSGQVAWQDSMNQMFHDRFGLAQDFVKENMPMDKYWVKQERQSSPSFPDVMTIYLTHEVRIRVADPSHPKMSVIGLPDMRSFNTKDGQTTSKWAWTSLSEESSNEDMLAQLLSDHNIDVSNFEPGAFTELHDEVYVDKCAHLTVTGDDLARHLSIVKVLLCADILSLPHTLVIKSKVGRGGLRDTSSANMPISIRMRCGQRWQEAACQALHKQLGVDSAWINANISMDHGSHQQAEEIAYSSSFQGLKSVYTIHEVTCQVINVNCGKLGLPDGHDFGAARWETRKDSTNNVPVVTCYGWLRYSEMMRKTLQRHEDEGVTTERRRCQLPRILSIDAWTIEQSQRAGDFSIIGKLMESEKVDLGRATAIAVRIRDSGYTAKQFWTDCLECFPELSLYVLDATTLEDSSTQILTTSGRSCDDEYQRTMGALLAVFWLMRIDIDGAEGFSFGVSDTGEPLTAASEFPRRSKDERGKRRAFYENAPWELFQAVFVDAGLLMRSTDGSLSHDTDRTLAMLVLTVIHDVMKVQALLPVVRDAHVEWCGYHGGEQVTDHDAALGYVLEYAGDMLPSFVNLNEKQKEAIKFTQCKMDYNMGWLTQAEAPPGALFSKFRSVILGDGADYSNIAFYFSHWLTDLAGAEPSPVEGCEKFAVKFPLRVLDAFLKSFSFVEQLSSKSETEVMEDYLKWRWEVDMGGGLSSGTGSVAKVRLVVMAQSDPLRVLDAFSELQPEYALVLSTELARTGCQNQSFRCDPGPDSGPAFLVYYAPAFLQKNAMVDPRGALEVLAQVLCGARCLWPARKDAVGDTVIVHIDSLRDVEVSALRDGNPGESWIMQRLSNKDAVVKKLNRLSGGGLERERGLGQHVMLRFDAGTETCLHLSVGDNMDEEPERPTNVCCWWSSTR